MQLEVRKPSEDQEITAHKCEENSNFDNNNTQLVLVLDCFRHGYSRKNIIDLDPRQTPDSIPVFGVSV